MMLSNFKYEIQKYRADNNLTRKQFAELVDIPHQRIKNYENGAYNPRKYSLIKMLDVMGLEQKTVDELLFQVMSAREQVETLVSDYLGGKITVEEIAVRIGIREQYVMSLINNSKYNIHGVKAVKNSVTNIEKQIGPPAGKSIWHHTSGTIADWKNMSEKEKEKYK